MNENHVYAHTVLSSLLSLSLTRSFSFTITRHQRRRQQSEHGKNETEKMQKMRIFTLALSNEVTFESFCRIRCGWMVASTG